MTLLDRPDPEQAGRKNQADGKYGFLLFWGFPAESDPQIY